MHEPHLTRRSLLLLLAGGLPGTALAEHGWKPYAGVAPVYLEGEVTKIIWADPHPHLELAHRTNIVLPPDLARRRTPRTRDGRRVQELLALARVPQGTNRIWRVELPTLARLTAWELPRPKTKDIVAVIGLLGPPLLDTPTVAAEILFIRDRLYPVRAEPA